MLRQFDAFLSVGSRNRAYLRHYGVPDQKIFFVPHSVDNDWFAARAEEAQPGRAEQRRKWGAGPETLVVLFVGKFISQKRPLDLLNATRVLALEGKDVIAVFIGSGELGADLRAGVVRAGLRAKFEGFRNQTELPPYYVASDVVVLPSESETWGLVVNEAMACGRPGIVSNAVGCCPDLIDEGKTGLSFRMGSVEELAACLSDAASRWGDGPELSAHLEAKLQTYSPANAVRGTLDAVNFVAGRI